MGTRPGRTIRPGQSPRGPSAQGLHPSPTCPESPTASKETSFLGRRTDTCLPLPPSHITQGILGRKGPPLWHFRFFQTSLAQYTTHMYVACKSVPSTVHAPKMGEPVRGPLSHAFQQNIKHYMRTLKEASTTSSPPQHGFSLAEAARPPPAQGRHPHGLSLLFTPLCSWQKVLAGLGARST